MRFRVSSRVPSEADWGSVWTQKSVERPPEALLDLRGLRGFEMALGLWLLVVVPVVVVVVGIYWRSIGGLGFCSGDALAGFAVGDDVDGGFGLAVGGVVGLAHAAGLANMGRTCS